MEMSISRKVLNVASIIDYVAGFFELALCALAVFGGVVGIAGSGAAENVAGFVGSSTVLGVGIYMGINGLMAVLSGYLGRRAVKDPAKVMPIWFVSLVSLILGAADVVIDLMNKVPASDMSGSFVGLAIAIVIFVIANNIKKEAGR